MTGPGEGTTEPHSSDLVELANKAYERAELQNMRAMQEDAVDFGYADDRDPMRFVVAELTPLIEARVRQQIADAIEATRDYAPDSACSDYDDALNVAVAIARGDAP